MGITDGVYTATTGSDVLTDSTVEQSKEPLTFGLIADVDIGAVGKEPVNC